MASVVPSCPALVLCERVERDPRTALPSIVRAFDAFPSKSFRATSRPFCVWLQVTNGNGPARMELIIERIPPERIEADVPVRTPFDLDFRNPNALLEHVVIFDDGIDLDEVGRYRLRLTANSTTVTQRYFIVAGTQ